MAEIVLIRGVPGAGKTTMAKRDFPSHVHVEADHFMCNEHGVYEYDPKKVSECHRRCRKATKRALGQGKKVVVANTFTRIWEMEPYFEMGYPVRVIEATGDYENVHGVPRSAVERMRARFEPYSC